MRGPSIDGADRFNDIRHFFLSPRERYSLGDLMAIWRIPLDDMLAMFSDTLDAADGGQSNPAAFEVSAAEAHETAAVFSVFRPIEVEQALADDFERVRPAQWRTIPLVVHVPRFVVDTLTRYPFIPVPDSLPACDERLLCELAEVDRTFVSTASLSDTTWISITSKRSSE